MAVPAGEREEGKFTLPIKAELLARHTLNITKNENVFRPEYRKTVTDAIIYHAMESYMEIRDANDTSVRMGTKYQKTDWLDRREHQKKAIHHCRRLLWMIDIAHRAFHLPSKRVQYWSEMVINVRNRTQSWMLSDEARYDRS